MSDVVMLEAALFQLRNGAQGLSQLDVFFTVLSNASAGAGDGINAGSINDIAVALNDLTQATGELPAADYNRLAEPLQMLRDDVARLKEQTSLSRELVDRIRAFQQKLRARAWAIEQ